MEVYIIVIAFFVGITGAQIVSGGQLEVNTCDRIQRHGYPCENHTVTTPDGYILTLFRLPHGCLEMSDKGEPRPAVLIMHCLLCSSDFFVLNGPNDGLPFMLADAGYDVWLGNARGNIYSQRHVNLSSLSEEFWDFSLDQIGLIDVPTKIDYILKTTSESKLHYIGFSQGTTVFMMLLSSQPSYGEKIKTAHLLGPGVYFCHLRSPPALLIQKFLGRPSGLANIIGTLPSQGFTGILRLLGSNVCKFPLFTELCIEILNLFSGWDSPYLNRTLLTDLLTSTPADGSNQQINQYMQFITKCEFKRYDYGAEGNLRKYGDSKPPIYDLKNIHLGEPIEFYFAVNDFFATPEDIHSLFDEIGMQGNWNRVKLKKYNHFDLVLSINVKTCINNCIVDKLLKYEGRPFNGTLCKCFRNKAFEEG
ncbi:lipase 3-like [Musca domestica]|uniref:Lipase n=1 Tax=Musca domestica TaxID=7370 RepID=A0A1I8MKL4_MUSDO|nr:lipase 3-like [Musca domestica]